jgi:hypothetical protein
MAEGGTTLATGVPVVVAEAGKRVQLPTTAKSFAGKTIMVQALGTNEGIIVVGDNAVVAAPGSHASPTQRGIGLSAGAFISIDLIDGAQIWLDTTKSGDGVTYMVLQA